jgi:hypothetical protein
LENLDISQHYNQDAWVDILNLEFKFDPETTNNTLNMVADYFEKHQGAIDKKR